MIHKILFSITLFLFDQLSSALSQQFLIFAARTRKTMLLITMEGNVPRQIQMHSVTDRIAHLHLFEEVSRETFPATFNIVVFKFIYFFIFIYISLIFLFIFSYIFLIFFFIFPLYFFYISLIFS